MKKIFLVLVAVSTVFMIVGYASADLNDGLLAYWPFNGNANDESGNGNDGVVFGATPCEDRFGNMDSAYRFDGVDDYINIGNNVKPPFPVSVSFWVNAKDLDANDCGPAGVVRNDQYDDGAYRYGLTVRVNDGYFMAHYFEGFSAPWNRIGYISNDALISAGKWYHLVALFNAHKNIQLFVNGVEILGSYDDGYGSGMSYTGSGNGAIGQFKANNPRRTCYFNGMVDELRFYNRALSKTEIQQLYLERPKNPMTEIIGTWDSGIWYSYPPYWDSGRSQMHPYTPDGAYPSGDIEAGDTNGDGVADVASCWSGSNGLRLQNGKTRGWETVYGGQAPYKVTMANVYGDARKEVIGTWDSGVFYFYRTSSGWAYKQIADASYVEPTADITAGDITGDGWDEIVSGYTTGTWIWNSRLSYPASWKKIAEPEYIIYNLACGDQDGDGRAEVIGGYNTGVWLWDGYWKKRLTDEGYVTKADMEMGDFNNNGRDDLVICFSDPVGMWINYDDGSWYKAYDIPPYRVTAGNLIDN